MSLPPNINQSAKPWEASLRLVTWVTHGWWSVPGGCLDEGESLPAGAAREAREELGITIDPADLTFAHLCHHADADGQARIGVFFAATRWSGEPVNAEPGNSAYRVVGVVDAVHLRRGAATPAPGRCSCAPARVPGVLEQRRGFARSGAADLAPVQPRHDARQLV
nr:NUDIX domain-containing protein [Thermomonospora umbrina]